MDNTSYTNLTRQTGLMTEMSVIANNIANAATTGFRQEGLVFSEYVQKTGGGSSVSMATARAHNTSQMVGAMTQTGGTFDLALDGPGFFTVETPSGPRLTRAGHFMPNAQGDLVTPDGHPVLDAGGAPLFVPAGTADIAFAPDGTLSADGQPIGQIGIVVPAEGTHLVREDGVRFRADGAYAPAEDPQIRQGFLEGSNVDPLSQIARMIEVQRAYEMGQTLSEKEDERLRKATDTMIR